MQLSKLFEGVIKFSGEDVEVCGVVSDSRKVKPGVMFVAYRGVGVDGHKFIDQAIKNGAAAIVGEKLIGGLVVPYFRVENGRLAWAQMMANWYDNPQRKLKMIGVTGTDGKTTTSTLIYEILKLAGRKVGLISTISARIDERVIDTGYHTTSPDPDIFFRLLAEMRESGCEYAVVETTSHSLAQYRDGDIEYEIGVLTNIAQEHLELHGSLEMYKEAKGKLFKRSKTSILNGKSFELGYFRSISKGRTVIYDVDMEVRNQKYFLREDNMTQRFEMKFNDNWVTITTELPGTYNQENILAAAKTAEAIGISQSDLKMAVSRVKRIRGRFELVENDLGFHIVVDFAHTDQAMHNVLSLVRDSFKGDGNVITVFGCIGERGQSKRFSMGKEACGLSDKVVVTADDPRNEPLEDIFKKIEAGCKSAGGLLDVTYFREDDREEAIGLAILKLAKKGDWVMILGKGHEQSINIGGVELPWDDVSVVKRILERYGK